MRSLSLGTQKLPAPGQRASLALENAELLADYIGGKPTLDKPTFKTDDAKPDDAKKDGTKPADL